MSLKQFIALKDVKDRLKPFRPPPPRKIGVPIRVESRGTKDGNSMIGTAFDYLLRFELQRQVPHLVGSDERWVAEHTPNLVKNLQITWGDVAAIKKQMESTLSNARMTWKAYVGNRNPSDTKRMELATYAMKLAKLEPLFRRGVLAPDYNEVDSESVSELMDLLAIVPWKEFIHSKMLLNPTFPASIQVGGADGDLVTGDLLVDFKVVSKNEHNSEHFDQLLGYYLLANHCSRHVPIEEFFVQINKVGIYYCRHGYLWSMPVSFWTEQADFPKLKEWFFVRANEIYKRGNMLVGKEHWKPVS
jgi:hypothetical protein